MSGFPLGYAIGMTDGGFFSPPDFSADFINNFTVAAESDYVTDISDYSAGDTLRIDYTIVNADGSPTDLTGVVFKWALAPSEDLSHPILQKTVGSGLTVINVNFGWVSALIVRGEVPAAGLYQHELERVLADGTSYTERGYLEAVATIYPNT